MSNHVRADVTLKETSLDKVLDDITRADFIIGVEEFCSHVGNLDDLARVSNMLMELRLLTANFTTKNIVDIPDVFFVSVFRV